MWWGAAALLCGTAVQNALRWLTAPPACPRPPPLLPLAAGHRRSLQVLNVLQDASAYITPSGVVDYYEVGV